MNHQRGPTSSSSSSSNKEGLVNKLQDALSKFRNERDQLHRSKELALERCRLIRQEEAFLTKTVDSMRQKENQIKTTCHGLEKEIGPLEAMVLRDTKEMQFQHAELLGARAKIKDLNEEMKRSATAREERLFKARQLVCQLRNRKKETKKGPELPIREQKQGLKRELDYNLVDFMDILFACMEERISQWESQSSHQPVTVPNSGVMESDSNVNEMPPPNLTNGTTVTISSLSAADRST